MATRDRKRLSDSLYPDTSAVSAVQRTAALRAEKLLDQMGPQGSMSVDDRYRENFLGTKYGNPQHIEAYPAMRLLNQALNVARDSRAPRKPDKGGF